MPINRDYHLWLCLVYGGLHCWMRHAEISALPPGFFREFYLISPDDYDAPISAALDSANE